MIAWFNGLPNILQVILIVAVIIGIVLLIIGLAKTQYFKFVFISLFYLVLVTSAIYCTIQLDAKFKASGGIIGQITNMFKLNDVEVNDSEDIEIKVSNLSLTKYTEDKYNAIINIDSIPFDNSDYIAYVNGVACKVINTGNYISFSYEYAFYSNSNALLMTDALSFNIVSYNNYSVLTIETNGGSDAVEYWNTYFERESLEIVIKVDSITEDDVPGENEYPVVNYYVNNELVNSVINYTDVLDTTYYTNLLNKYCIDTITVNESEVDSLENLTITEDTNIYLTGSQAGLYNNNNLTMSWQSIIDAGYLSVDNGQLNRGDSVTSLSGDLIIPSAVNSFWIGTSTSAGHIGLFANCTNLTSVTIPNTVEDIGTYVFYGCSNLGTVKLPNKLTWLRNGAFGYCSNLTSIVLPNSLTDIKSGVFTNCTNLSNIVIPDSVTYIGSGAFRDCTSLTSVTIGESVETIDISAFYNTTALTEINFNAKNCEDFLNTNLTFYNAGSLGNGIDIVFGETVETIPAYLFYSYNYEDANLPNLKSITIGSGVTFIGNYAFYKSSSLDVIIESEIIYDSLNNYYTCGFIGQSSDVIRVLKSVDDGSNTYLNNTSNFSKTEDTNYYIYTKI